MTTAIVFAMVALSWAPQAQAGVFNLYHFLSPGAFGIGLEPELNMTGGASIGANIKYTQGLTDINNFTAIIGTGGGNRGFRFGGNFTFDIFPDVDKQPGIGIAAQAIYYRAGGVGLLELTGIPYVHKTFLSTGNEIDPFLAIPIGYGFADGKYQALSSIAVGSRFKGNEFIHYFFELGFPINNANSYISGGLAYYH